MNPKAKTILHTDVAVVGAGPAGSIAAHRLASAGIQVALVERATFPRDKACGDGISAQGLAVLARTGLSDWASQFNAPKILRLTSPRGQVIDIEPKVIKGHCYGRVIPRRELDARLAQAAVEAGARLLEGTRVKHIEHQDNRLRIAANGSTIETKIAILADGSHVPITGRLGLATRVPEMLAIRQYFSGDVDPGEKMELIFQSWCIPGYTWLFPISNGIVNVGTGTFTHKVRREKLVLRDILQRFVIDPTSSNGRLAHAEPIGHVRGHPLRTDLKHIRTHAERILVAGDAAGLVSPLSGEGIPWALESGELAATHTLIALQRGDFSARTLAAYSRALWARYGASQRAARIVRAVLSKPHMLNRIFAKLQQDDDLAMLIGLVILSHKPAQLALHPKTLLRLLT
jgi:geranylgeranyl reductase family protein